MRDHGYSEAGFARAAGLPQPTVHRALCRPVRLSKTHRRLCKFAGIDLNSATGSAETREDLVQELLDVWDGTREHAQTLVRLLRAAAMLQAYGETQAVRTR